MAPEYDTLNIEDSSQIVTTEDLSVNEPEEVAAEEAPAEPETAETEVISEEEVIPEEASPEEPEQEDETDTEDAPEAEDELMNVLAAMRDQIAGLIARLDAAEARLAEAEAREAARGKKLTGFFAPIPEGKDPEADPLPRIEKLPIYK